MNKDDMFRVGVVSSTHGIKGEVKVYPTTDDLKRFDYLKEVYLDTGRELLKLEVENVKYFKGQAILKFTGFDKIEDVERFKQKDLLVTRENAIPLEEGEYYVKDMLGLTVYDDTDLNNPIGTLTDVLKTAANDIYVVTDSDNKEILIPCTEECFKGCDLEKGMMFVHQLKWI